MEQLRRGEGAACWMILSRGEAIPTPFPLSPPLTLC